MCPRELFSLYKNLSGLSFATKRIGPPCCALFTFVTCFSLQIILSQNYLFPLISVLAENTLLKTAYHFLPLLVGFDTLTYQKDYNRPPILVGHQYSARNVPPLGMKRYPLPLIAFKFFSRVNIEQQECCVNFCDFSGFFWIFLCINWVFHAFMCIIQIWTTCTCSSAYKFAGNQWCPGVWNSFPNFAWDLSMHPRTHIWFFNQFICTGEWACSSNLNYAHKMPGKPS